MSGKYYSPTFGSLAPAVSFALLEFTNLREDFCHLAVVCHFFVTLLDHDLEREVKIASPYLSNGNQTYYQIWEYLQTNGLTLDLRFLI